MKKIRFMFPSFLVLLTTMTACGHDDDDVTVPAVTITDPLNLSVFNTGDTVWIKGNVSDNELHEMSVEIKNDTTGTILYTSAVSVHGLTSHNYSKFWKNNVSHNTAATVTVMAEDHAGHHGTASVKIALKP